VTESLAGFLAAEQMVEQSVSESRIHEAIDDAQARQQNYNTARPQPKGKRRYRDTIRTLNFLYTRGLQSSINSHSCTFCSW